MLEEKIIALQNYLNEQQTAGLLLASLGHEINDSVLTYLLGSEPEQVAILITPDKAVLWLTPFEVPEAILKFPEFEVSPLNQPLYKLVQATLPPSTLLIRESVLSVSLAKTLTDFDYKLISAQNIWQIVAQKNQAEITAMRLVCAKTDKLFSSLIEHWSEFKNEQDAARFIYQFALENNCEVSFPPIIACAANAAEPHHQTNTTELTRGFCVIDLGLKINGYCSDMSRTIFIGEPIQEEIEIYELVKKAQAAATALIKPGVKACEIDRVCREILGGYENNFIHGLGHGVGTAVHEWPSISATSQAILKEGMIITIEPGIYFSGKFGIRIEDDILVNSVGFEVLNQTTKDLIIIS